MLPPFLPFLPRFIPLSGGKYQVADKFRIVSAAADVISGTVSSGLDGALNGDLSINMAEALALSHSSAHSPRSVLTKHVHSIYIVPCLPIPPFSHRVSHLGQRLEDHL